MPHDPDPPRAEVGPHPRNIHPLPSDGRRWTGPFEEILHRCWEPGTDPGQQVITAVDRLATLPADLTGRLVEGLKAIYLGTGMVVDFPVMADLRDQPVDPARPCGATWNSIPAAYRSRVIVIGSGGQPLAVDLLLHEAGHALDDIDGQISDSEDFRALHLTCADVMADSVRDRFVTGYAARAEFFCEAFGAVYLRAWDVLETWLGGNLERAYNLRGWYARTYGIGR